MCDPFDMSRVVRKSAFCICENKDADQLGGNLRGNREADQRLCFCYKDSTIPLLPKYEISSLWLSSVVVQPRLCGTWSETPDRFSHNEARIIFCSFRSQKLLLLDQLVIFLHVKDQKESSDWGQSSNKHP